MATLCMRFTYERKGNMAVPKFFEFFPVVMECLLPGEAVNAQSLRDFAVQRLNVSEEDRKVLVPSGKQSMFYNRVSWAATYLKKAELIASPKRGQYQITPKGRAAWKETGGHINLKYLSTIDSFVSFQTAVPADAAEGEKKDSQNEESTPQDVLDAAYEKIKSTLMDDLLAEIMGQTPAFFERLVVELLVKMGYGGTVENPGTAIGRTGDEGIDGVIREDKLGFSYIYIQAKRWDINITIGRPEIQRFFGALAGQHGSKGLFITTARFSREAREYADRQHIVLVDGRKLAELMIDHNLGVSPRIVYEIKRIDTDYFSDEE